MGANFHLPEAMLGTNIAAQINTGQKAPQATFAGAVPDKSVSIPDTLAEIAKKLEATRDKEQR